MAELANVKLLHKLRGSQEGERLRHGMPQMRQAGALTNFPGIVANARDICVCCFVCRFL